MYYFSQAIFTMGLSCQFLFTFIFLPVASTFSQPTFLKARKANSTITMLTVDRAGDFYIVEKSGVISKFDKDGELIASFAAGTGLTTFDPTNAIRLLVWYKDSKTYAWLSPTLENPGMANIDPSLAIEPQLMCPSGDYAVWIYDAADQTMKRVQLNESIVQSEFPLESSIPEPEISSIKEYLNFLFVVDDAKGLFVFNSRGRLLKRLNEPKTMVHFLGEELYFVYEGKLHFFNLYTAETRTLPLPNPAKAAVLTDERMIVQADSSQLHFYRWQP